MTAKEYLSQARCLEARIRGKHEELERLKTWLGYRSPDASGVPGSSSGGDWTNTVDKIVDLRNQIEAELAALVTLDKEIRAAIGAVESDLHRTLLELRYLSMCTWSAIAETLHYDERSVYRLHGTALKMVCVPGGCH